MGPTLERLQGTGDRQRSILITPVYDTSARYITDAYFVLNLFRGTPGGILADQGFGRKLCMSAYCVEHTALQDSVPTTYRLEKCEESRRYGRVLSQNT